MHLYASCLWRKRNGTFKRSCWIQFFSAPGNWEKGNCLCLVGIHAITVLQESFLSILKQWKIQFFALVIDNVIKHLLAICTSGNTSNDIQQMAKDQNKCKVHINISQLTMFWLWARAARIPWLWRIRYEWITYTGSAVRHPQYDFIRSPPNFANFYNCTVNICFWLKHIITIKTEQSAMIAK